MPHFVDELMIRLEEPCDLRSIRVVNLAAFETPAEADLVDALRTAVEPFLSLVAATDHAIVGHIAFTPVTVHSAGGESWSALALGPMAVLPSHQNRGIGSALVRAGLDECRARGHHIVFVLGHPNFYPRFGFFPARTRGFTCAWDVPDEVFMVADLSPNALAGRTGQVRYHSLFETI